MVNEKRFDARINLGGNNMLRDLFGSITGETRRRYNRRTALGTVLGLLGGAATGAILGLLFAPKSGKETRKDIADATEEGYKRTKKAASDLGEKISATTSKLGSEINKASGKLGAKVSDTYNEFKDNIEDVKDQRKVARIARRNQANEHSDSPVAGQALVTPNFED